jgi:hypothetical protein
MGSKAIGVEIDESADAHDSIEGGLIQSSFSATNLRRLNTVIPHT